jgi:hypothetical protein
MKIRGFPLALVMASTTAVAHDGHGLEGGHWHASDAFGFVLVLVLAVAMMWWSRRK